uniref:Jun dimerization protein 2 n=1 Tax=Felis catus TaxID=9685 RepID=A0ABI7ZU36_FELCA
MVPRRLRVPPGAWGPVPPRRLLASLSRAAAWVAGWKRLCTGMLLHNRPPRPASPRGGRRGTRGSPGCRCPRGERSARSGGRRAPGAAGEVKLDEEEERRKRRREKNKVAAARCRNKKKERTEFLQRESERLELMNAELKTQIEELKQERQQLILMLNRHRPTCIVRTDSVKTPESEGNPLLEQLEKK